MTMIPVHSKKQMNMVIMRSEAGCWCWVFGLVRMLLFFLVLLALARFNSPHCCAQQTDVNLQSTQCIQTNRRPDDSIC